MFSTIDEPKLNNEKQTPIEVSYHLTTLLLLFYTGYCFYNYFAIYESMNSNLLPNYASSYAYGYDFALNGLISVVGVFISHILNWLKQHIIALICNLSTTTVIAILIFLK